MGTLQSENRRMTDTHEMYRPTIGHVYKGSISIGDLGHLLTIGTIKYAPKYQRGYRQKYVTEEKNNSQEFLLAFTQYDGSGINPEIEIDKSRIEEMAAKYLAAHDSAINGTEWAGKVLYNPNVVWNIRKDEKYSDQLVFDDTKDILSFHGEISVPDSGHRHVGLVF